MARVEALHDRSEGFLDSSAISLIEPGGERKESVEHGHYQFNIAWNGRAERWG